ncbi:MAG: FHA domain-containing protein [Anaerolineales bacterium]
MTAILFLIIRILFVIALYGFLSWGLWTLWYGLKQDSQALSSDLLPSISILELENGQSYQFKKMQIIIGRDLSCDLCLSDNTISAQHTRLAYHHNQWWIEDLKSTNGTFVNGVPVSEPIVVTSADEVRIGKVNLQINL